MFVIPAKQGYVIPAKAGIHLKTKRCQIFYKRKMDSRFRGNDVLFDLTCYLTFTDVGDSRKRLQQLDLFSVISIEINLS